MARYFTIGMAGHIDHGKTALTKALTGENTDRLQEEKERSISIEPGFALLINNDQLEVSIIDVPGHERFIRQMIAGSAGIDMAVLVIAANEGVMPQTKEHLDILSLLGIQNGLVVMTKVDQVDQELLDIVLDDVKETMDDTFLKDAPIHLVDSLSEKGIPELKQALTEEVLHMRKPDRKTSFRLPIDQVFTVKGQGVVVRGTIYDGDVKQGEHLKVLPLKKDVRVRQIQRHHQQKTMASAGQRTAINIGGVSRKELSRGDVLVTDDFFSVTNLVDIVFYPLKDRKHKVKQRQPIKLFIGTSEVMGKIIFFDRNEIDVSENQEVLCQIQLDKEVVITRGDRFILRKPTPIETIGGGWVIEPDAKKYRFGKKTIEQLELKKEGSPKDRVIALMEEKKVLTRANILKEASISERELREVEKELLAMEDGLFTLNSTFVHLKTKIIDLLETFHNRFPMRIGIDKAEMMSELTEHYPVSLIEFAMKTLKEESEITIRDQYVSLANVKPALPSQWKTRLESAEKALQKQGLEPGKWNELLDQHQIPLKLQKEFYYYLLETASAYVLDDERLIAKDAADQALRKLQEFTNGEDFTIGTAKDHLQLTRKNMVPLLELYDQLGYTKRTGNMRTWVKKVPDG
ncbi:selenocysteine-specific translation elongation factor [Lentibacillus cibarius]|uniref:Selenocysteine-specific elongation factor n=1 Tax=Lentibacillus cibarius TaxID=2583219 RepID=A0A5S3R7Z9_9BACI|nr:selenocysteine-specific translation elongation factor [Lentibacillus cibarius]TMN23193.1 selenocysteine-specific translation elongation factor [Lentibacillus cibarius]